MAAASTAIPTVPATGGNPSAPLVAETDLEPSAEISPAELENVRGASENIAPAPAVDTGASTGTTAGKKSTGLVVHHLNDSRSQRLLWLLEELELPYSIEKYERNDEMRAPKELKKIHSLGKSPVLTDGDVVIAESGAITEYVISKYGEKFRPTEAGKIDDLYFSHYAEGSFAPIIINKLIFAIIPQRSPAFIRPLLRPVFAGIVKKLLDPELKAHCELIESYLEKTKTGWLAGCDHPTSADFMMVFPIELLVSQSQQFAGPKTKEYIKRIHQRPAYKRSLEKGGKYEYAKL